MKQVMKAQPYRAGRMGSLGDAAHMLLRQYRFPDTYRDDEVVSSHDHDRIHLDNMTRWSQIVAKHFPRDRAMEAHFPKDGVRYVSLNAFLTTANERCVLRFLKELLSPYAGDHPWTGFRILGTVNRSNGYPVYSLELFAKRRNSDTNVYTGDSDDAPNVEGARFNRHRMWDETSNSKNW